MTALLNKPVPFRARRSMAGAACVGRLYLLGGVGAKSGTESILDVTDELWRFDPRTLEWREILHAEPWPSARRCVEWTAAGARLWLWAGSGVNGRTYTFLDDLWAFDPVRETWARHDLPLGPPARYTPVFEAVADLTFLCAGYTEDAYGKRMLNDAWLLGGGSRDAVKGPSAKRRVARYRAVSARQEDAVIVCGGCSRKGDLMDVWRFDLRGDAWECICPDDRRRNNPWPRYCAAAAIRDDMLFLFGGRSRRQPTRNYNDLWRLDLETARWECLQPARDDDPQPW